MEGARTGARALREVSRVDGHFRMTVCRAGSGSGVREKGGVGVGRW